MSETPIGDAVESEFAPGDSGLEQNVADHVELASPYVIPGEEPEGWTPDEDAVDPEPVMNEDADDPLDDVEEGEDDGETPLEDDEADAEPES